MVVGEKNKLKKKELIHNVIEDYDIYITAKETER